MTIKTIKTGKARILADECWGEAISPCAFDPGAYPDAQPVQDGGRSAAWFIDTPAGPAVLRRFRRGGMLGRFINESYLRSAPRRCRSFREFALLRKLHRKGVPVAQPIAAICHSRGLISKMGIITRRIPDAVSLQNRVQSLKPQDESLEQLASRCAHTIRAMHEAGIWHADLNAYNLLVDSNNTVFVIDLDKGREQMITKRLAHANLARLGRSLQKHDPAGRGKAFWLKVKKCYDKYPNAQISV